MKSFENSLRAHTDNSGKGITLIALIITIIVLLILAAVTINMVLGENGLFNKAKTSVDVYQKTEALEKIEIKIVEINMQKYEEIGRQATLQELADYLCEDDEIEYVLKQSKKEASLQKIDVSDVNSIFTKLQKAPYEFEIGKNGEIETIDGIKIKKDKEPPKVKILSMEKSPEYLFAIKAQVLIEDEISSIDYSKCKYIFTETNTPIGKNIKDYTDGNITDTGIIEKVKGPATYYLHVLAIDSEGNASEVISEDAVTVDNVANYQYDSSNKYQKVSLLPGTYQFECWGASGGKNITVGVIIDNKNEGGYTSGIIHTSMNETLYIYLGEEGKQGNMTSNVAGGYNGGGIGRPANDSNDGGGSGGGATDIRCFGDITPNNMQLEWNSFDGLKSRIMVAAGGAGGATIDYSLSEIYNSNGISGGLYGYGEVWRWQKTVCSNNYNATQNGGYAFGYGSAGKNSHAGGSGAGGGYYGANASLESNTAGGTGGSSSFISGHNGCNAIKKESTSNNIVHSGQANHYSGLIFSETKMIDGNGYSWTTQKGQREKMPNPNGEYYDLGVGHTGNGCARITNKN